jgi:hypothetical protein
MVENDAIRLPFQVAISGVSQRPRKQKSAPELTPLWAKGDAALSTHPFPDIGRLEYGFRKTNLASRWERTLIKMIMMLC